MVVGISPLAKRPASGMARGHPSLYLGASADRCSRAATAAPARTQDLRCKVADGTTPPPHRHHAAPDIAALAPAGCQQYALAKLVDSVRLLANNGT